MPPETTLLPDTPPIPNGDPSHSKLAGVAIALGVVGVVLLVPTWGLSAYIIEIGAVMALIAVIRNRRDPLALTAVAVCAASVAILAVSAWG